MSCHYSLIQEKITKTHKDIHTDIQAQKDNYLKITKIFHETHKERKKDKYYTFANDHKDKDTHSYRKKKSIHK